MLKTFRVPLLALLAAVAGMAHAQGEAATRSLAADVRQAARPPASQAAAPPRRLSAQEREELRRLLRQQSARAARAAKP